MEAEDTINSMLSCFDERKKHAFAIPGNSTAHADAVLPVIAPEVVNATPPVTLMWSSAPPQFQGPYSSVKMQLAQLHAPRLPRFQQQPQ